MNSKQYGCLSKTSIKATEVDINVDKKNFNGSTPDEEQWVPGKPLLREGGSISSRAELPHRFLIPSQP